MLIRRSAFDEIGGLRLRTTLLLRGTLIFVFVCGGRAWGPFFYRAWGARHPRARRQFPPRLRDTVKGFSKRRPAPIINWSEKYHSRGYWWLYRHLCILHARKMVAHLQAAARFWPSFKAGPPGFQQ